MTLSILVTNQPPETDADVPGPVQDLFQAYTRATDKAAYLPFRHQAEAFRLVMEDKELFLVAGTAAGKTLAIAVPLLAKLREGRIRKVLFLYPTIALMEDQRRVMDTLAGLTGLQVSQLQGGMSRSELIAALNRPVILATPDEIYWFFRKNVKYSSLLIYGLALVDEFVLDEAHLFSGLMLQNLKHLQRRVRLLAARLGKRPRWHILTATPTPALRLLTRGAEVRGRSKCGEVEVTFLEPAGSSEERQGKLVDAVETALAGGAPKVLLVLNSADLAHRLFSQIKGEARPPLPPELQWRFGLVTWGRFRDWWQQKGVAEDTIFTIERYLKREEPVYLKDLHQGTRVALPADAVAAGLARLLEGQSWVIKRLLYAAAREGVRDPIEFAERRLQGKGKVSRLLWREIRPGLQQVTDSAEIIASLDAYVSLIQDGLERYWPGDYLLVTAPGGQEIGASLQGAGVGPELAAALTDHLCHTLALPEAPAAGLNQPSRELETRRLPLSALEWMIKDPSQRQALQEQVLWALAGGELEVDTRHLAVWGETGVPVVIYTGKMSRNERRGLLEAFALLPRAVLISTPAVEVGVDFAADVLVTEQCDGNGFLQRFGRVGRRAGTRGRVVVLVREGPTYVRLFQNHRPQMSREEFSAFIADPEEGLFPSRLYAEGSAFLDATHWLVNAQLGACGEELNREMFDHQVAALGQKLRETNLPFAYGLRSTLPTVALLGGAGGGEPFYVLRKVPNTRLLPGDSPFEMARADMWYTEFLWRPAAWKCIVVDAEATLASSQALFWWQSGQWQVKTGYGIAADYARLFSPEPASRGKALGVWLSSLEKTIRGDLAGFLAQLQTESSRPLPRLLLQIGEILPLFFEPHARLLLGQGDVHLLRVDADGIPTPVKDQLDNPLVLPDHTWLLLLAYPEEEARDLLKQAAVLDLEEIIYDWGAAQIPGSLGPVLLDRVAGACFHVYRRMVEHAAG